VQAEVDSVEELMSPWIDESDLSRFADADVGAPVEVSPLTLEVVALAKATWEASGGAFDPTIGALVEASGFGVAPDVSERSERLAAHSAVGFKAIRIDAEGRSLIKLRDGVRLDLSAVAKGYAVDRAAEALSSGGYEDYFLEVGGEIFCRGVNGEGGEWVIGIEAPDMDPLAPRRVFVRLRLTGLGVATSGDYRNRRQLDGEESSHLFDPKSGETISSELGSVTVIAGDCATADAYATAAMVMGLEAGLSWLESSPEVEAVFVARDSAGALTMYETSGCAELRLTD
jgi:thiamine biosynthesis lipoprotein